jgi:lysophospholipase L1-like esterase
MASRSGRRLVAIAAFGWVLLAWLATHRSRSPNYFARYSPEYLSLLGFVLLVALVLTAIAVVGVRHPGRLPVLHWGGSLALMLAASVLSLAAAEILVRSFDLLGVSFFEEVTHYILALEGDDALVYKHRAGLETVYQGVPFTTNELGLRDRPVPAPSSDTLRVLILGDSVTLGWGVPVEATFARRLEGLLSARLGRPVRTINSAAAGYNTEQELAFLRRHIVSMAPDLVLLVYIENDVEPVATNVLDMKERWQHPPGANAWLLRWSWLYRLLYYTLPDHLGSTWRPPDTSGWQRSMTALAEAQRLAHGHGAPFVVFLCRMLPDEVTDTLWRDISRVGAVEGFPLVDTLPWFHGVPVRSLVNSFVDTHPNAEGHRFLAEGMARALIETGALCRAEKASQASVCQPAAKDAPPPGGRTPDTDDKGPGR